MTMLVMTNRSNMVEVKVRKHFSGRMLTPGRPISRICPHFGGAFTSTQKSPEDLKKTALIRFAQMVQRLSGIIHPCTLPGVVSRA